MPPRTRKSAEPAPPAPDTTTAADESEQQTPDSTGAETHAETESAPPVSEETALEPAGGDTPGAEQSAGAPTAAAVQPQAAYHWETTSGTPADPCRLCPPGGPPPGVGSYGCPHGQWVRVQGTD